MKKQEVIKGLQELGYIAEFQEAIKNGVVKEGVVIRTSEDEMVAPIVYFDPDFQDVDDEINRIVNLYEMHKRPQIDLDEFLRIENIADNLRVGFQQAGNEPLVKQKTIFEGIESYLFLLVRQYKDEVATAKIKPEMLKHYKISEEDAWRLAYVNTFQDTKVQTLGEMFGFETVENGFGIPPMHIVTNKNHCKGAANIMDANALKKIAEKFNTNKLIAIPASIHEFIVYPDNGYMGLEDLNQMVRDVNASEVIPEEVLSNKAYKITVDKEVRLG